MVYGGKSTGIADFSNQFTQGYDKVRSRIAKKELEKYSQFIKNLMSGKDIKAMKRADLEDISEQISSQKQYVSSDNTVLLDAIQDDIGKVDTAMSAIDEADRYKQTVSEINEPVKIDNGNINWQERIDTLQELLDTYKGTSNTQNYSTIYRELQNTMALQESNAADLKLITDFENKEISDTTSDQVKKQLGAIREAERRDTDSSFNAGEAINALKQYQVTTTNIETAINKYKKNPTPDNYKILVGKLVELTGDSGAKVEQYLASKGHLEPETFKSKVISRYNKKGISEDWRKLPDGTWKNLDTGEIYTEDEMYQMTSKVKPTTTKTAKQKLDNLQTIAVDNILADKKIKDEFSEFMYIFKNIEKLISDTDNKFDRRDATDLISKYNEYVEIRDEYREIATSALETKLEKAKNKFQKLLEAANKEIGKTDTKENKTQTKIKEYSVEKLSEFVNNFILKYDDFDKELRGVMYRQLLEQPNLTDEQRKKLKEATEKGKTQTPEEKWKPNVVE